MDNNYGNNEGNGMFSGSNADGNVYGQEQMNAGQNYAYGEGAPNQGYGGAAQNQNYGYGTPNQGYDNMNQNYAYGQNNYPNGNGGYQYAQQGGYEQELEPPVTVGEWIVAALLMMIPCVNIVLMFVWAFSSTEKKSKSNYFKANLIIMGVLLAIYIVLIAAMAIVMMAQY